MAKRSMNIMKSKLSVIVIVLIVSLGSVGLVGAGTTITPVTGNNYADTSPSIDGDYVVWQGYVNGNWEIFLYNIMSGNTDQITFNAFDDTKPQIDGNYAVWQGFGNLPEDQQSGTVDWEIFLYNISSHETIQVTMNNAQDHSPRIAGNWLAWMQAPGDDSDVQEIFLFRIPTGPTTPLTDNGRENAILQMDSNTLLWAEIAEPENTALYTCNLTQPNPQPELAPEDYVWTGDTPPRSGDLSVFAQYSVGDAEIFLRDTRTRQLEQITNNSIDDGLASIDESRVVQTGDDTEEAGTTGNFIVWAGGEAQDSEIYLGFRNGAFIATVTASEEADGAATTGGGGGGGGLCFINSMANVDY
jgi:beta propeller repeat protein